MSDTPKRLHVSASALKSLEQCSYSFYLARYLKLPEKVWARTSTGSAVHTILEVLRLDKHRRHYDLIMAAGTIYGSPAVARLVRRLQIQWGISSELIADIDPMCMLVFHKTNYLDIGATETFAPEHEFNLTLPGGGIARGFIDRIAIYGTGKDRYAVISDYKSQGRTFPKDELTNNMQASMYQLYAYRQWGLLARVEFILLRHPPTSRTPQKHLQIVPPASPAQLLGFEYYLDHMDQVFNNYGLREAYQSFCGDYGFCKNVCSFYRPFDYISVTDKTTGALVGNYALDKVPHLLDNQVAARLTYKGCPNHPNA